MGRSSSHDLDRAGPAVAHFERLWAAHHRHVKAYFLRRLPGHAVDDAVADVFTVAWRRLGDLPDMERELPWLYGVCVNVTHRYRRSNTRRARLAQRLGAEPGGPGVEPELQIVRKSEHEQVVRAAGQLAPLHREILLLTLWEELSQAEIADVLGISVGAVKQRLFRARRSLRREFSRLERERGSARLGSRHERPA